MGIGPIDITLWDFAGKYYDAPIHELLGSYRDRPRLTHQHTKQIAMAASIRPKRLQTLLKSV